MPKSLQAFIKSYRPQQAYVVNLDFSQTNDADSTAATFLPFHELLRQDAVI